MTTTTLVQVSFRARNDDVTLNSATFTHALNANFSQAVDINFRVRFTIAETTGGMANNVAYSLQYNLAGAGFVAIGDTAAVKSAISAQFANEDATTQVISTGSFVAGAGYEQTTTSNISLTSQRTEIEWSLSIDSTQVTNGQTFTLRVVQAAGAVLQTYTATPTITVVETAAFAASQAAYRFAEDGTESGATLIGTLNTTLARNVTADSNLQLRVRLQETGGVAGGATDDYQLQRAINGGAFASVTAASTAVKINTASALTDGAATTNRLGAGSGSFVAGEQEESDGLVDDHQLTASNFTEHVWALTLVAAEVSAADSLTFRVLRNGSVITYAVTPTITVEKTIPTVTSIDTDNDTVDTRTGVVIVGTNFEASETGLAKVEISNNATPGAGTVVEIDVTSWSATSITATLRRESDAAALATLLTLPLSPAYLWVTNSLGGQNPTGFQFTLRPAGPTAIAAVNTDAEIDAGTIFLLRFRVENTGGEGLAGFKLKRSHNGGGYVDVTTTSAVAEAVAAVAFADGDNSIEVLGGSGSYIADNNAGSEDGGFTLASNFPASGAVEPVFAVRIVEADVADTDTVAFRVYNSDDTELGAYTVTPTITVNIAAGDVTATPAAGALVVTGLAPTVAAAVLAEPTAGTIELTGLAPTVAASSTASPAVSAVTIVGLAPTAAADALIEPAASALELTVLAPTVVADAAIEPSLGALVITGFAPSVDAGASVSVTPDPGALELTALAPTLAAGAVLSPDVATLEIAGLAPTLSTSVSVEPGVAALEFTGFAPTVEVAGNVTVEPTVGSLEIVGLAPTVSIQQPPTAAGALNEDIDITVDTTYLIWARVENTGVEGGTDFRWSYNHEGAGWISVGIVIPEEEWSDETLWSDGTGWLEAEPNKVVAVNASSFANDDDVPERLTGPGTYLTDNNAATEDGTTTLPSNSPADGAVEFVLAFQIVGVLVQNGQTGQIRLELGDGTDLNAYTETFTYTVAGSGAVISEPTIGILELVGLAPIVMADVTVEPGVAQLDITGLPPTFAVSISAEPSLGAVEISGLMPTWESHVDAQPSLGDLEIVGLAPDAWGGTNELLAPDEILVASNLQDTNLVSPPVRLADIDEPVDSDDGEWWTLVGAVDDTEASLAFPPSSGPLSGPQKLRVRVRKTTGAATPQVRIELWYVGGIAPIAQITTDVTSDVGQVVELAFNADDLPDQDGDGVQIKFFGLAA